MELLIGLGAVVLGVLGVLSLKQVAPPGHVLLVRRSGRTQVAPHATWALPGQIFAIPLVARTLTLQCRRRNALRCADGVRADVQLEVALSLSTHADAILRATDVLGDRLDQPAAIEAHFAPRFMQALIAACQTRPFGAWRPDALAEAVIAAVGPDLDGFEAQSVAITRFEQAPLDAHDPENHHDAEGIRALTAQLEAERTRTEAIVQAATLERARNELASQRALAEIDAELAQYGGASESVLDRLRARRQAAADADDAPESAARDDDVEAIDAG